MRRLATALLAVFLLLSPAWSVTDLGDQAITRLWVGDDFACTGWYLSKLTVEKSRSPMTGEWKADWTDDDRGMAWLVSAGHCAEAWRVKRERDGMISGAVAWVAVLQSAPNTSHRFTDLAVGKVPDTRRDEHLRFLSLAERDAEPGEEVLIHGFPRGVERIVHGTVAGKRMPTLADALLVRIPPGDFSVWGGSSGSPVLNSRGAVVGVLWGLLYIEPEDFFVMGDRVQTPDRIKYALVTPVSRLKEVLKLAGVHGYHE